MISVPRSSRCLDSLRCSAPDMCHCFHQVATYCNKHASEMPLSSTAAVYGTTSKVLPTRSLYFVDHWVVLSGAWKHCWWIPQHIPRHHPLYLRRHYPLYCTWIRHHPLYLNSRCLIQAMRVRCQFITFNLEFIGQPVWVRLHYLCFQRLKNSNCQNCNISVTESWVCLNQDIVRINQFKPFVVKLSKRIPLTYNLKKDDQLTTLNCFKQLFSIIILQER